jgi:hypothetical protein
MFALLFVLHGVLFLLVQVIPLFLVPLPVLAPLQAVPHCLFPFKLLVRGVVAHGWQFGVAVCEPENGEQQARYYGRHYVVSGLGFHDSSS